jgi:hypothetical protein
MAEINYPANSAGTTGVRRSKKLSTKVDLTPMVDLGFLLITEYGTTTYSLTKGLGQVIRTKQITLDKMKPGFRKDLMLMIKPSAESVCRNMVDILDEVQINQVGHYAIMDLTPEEKKAIAIKTGLAL